MVAVRTPEVADLGPTIVNLIGVRGGDKNEMFVTLLQYGLPYDLTDRVCKAQVRQKATDTGPALVTAVITILGDPTLGRISISWPGDQVDAVLNGAPRWNGVWDFQTKYSTDLPVTHLAGTIEFNPDVTR